MMRSKISSLLFGTLLVAFTVSSVSPQNRRRIDPLNEMVQTERAFSRTSVEKGIRDAFLEFIAEDGILFRPRAVAGKKWLEEHPPPASSTRPLLVWEPVLAGISRAGDLGYTTGPWRRKNDIKDATPAAFGNFMTVWKKQPDGKWRFVVDLGIRNPDPKTQPKLVSVRPSAGRLTRGVAADRREDLLNTELRFSQASAARGAVEAFLNHSAADVRVLRNEHQPFIGRKAALKAMPPLAIEWTWTTAAAGVASSGDLGYSYGSYQLRDKTAGIISETGNFFRVWRNMNGAWKLILDLTDPLPAEKKN